MLREKTLHRAIQNFIERLSVKSDRTLGSCSFPRTIKTCKIILSASVWFFGAECFAQKIRTPRSFNFF